MAHTCNPITQEAEAGGLGIGGQSELHSETLSKQNEKEEEEIVGGGRKHDSNPRAVSQTSAYSGLDP